MNRFFRSALFPLILIVGAVFLVSQLMSGSGGSKSVKLTYSQLISYTKANKVQEVTFSPNSQQIKYVLKPPAGSSADTKGVSGKVNYPSPESEANYEKILQAHRVRYSSKGTVSSPWISILVGLLPFVLFFGIWIFLMNQMQGGGSRVMSFGKSRAKRMTPDAPKIAFRDVAGVDEAVEELQEIKEFLENPKKFQALGARIPKGVLLYGPPGTGKTLLARAVAGEAGVPFFSISGSDFVEMFVGVGASRVRDLFAQAKEIAPCIIFVDEIDAVGRHRGAGMGGGNDEREQTINQLLVEMDGFEANSGVIVIAATNRADVLDKALLRPGRFDRQVMVGLPDIRGREQILYVHMRKVPIAPDVKADILARGTPGFSGADLANLVNEAALFAARRSKRLVEMQDFEDAKDKIVMGPERKSAVMREEERRNTAYHESGHAVVAKLLPKADPVHKVTIMPRGYALGLTWQLPEHDRVNMYKDKMLEEIAILFGGRIAEEIFMHQMSTGASNDFERATKLARAMVTRYGMSEALGTMVYEDTEQDAYFGRMSSKTVSEATQQKVDAEIRSILDTQYALSRRLLEENRDKVEVMAQKLLDWETIDADQINDIMAGVEPRLPKYGVPVKKSSDNTPGDISPPTATAPA